jgi:hypothetical protein
LLYYVLCRAVLRRTVPCCVAVLQMEAYLKASRFRQTIEQHKRALGGGTALGPTPAGQQLQVGSSTAPDHLVSVINTGTWG